ncbi:hypothetical protein CU098_007750, partial [Rhizopus stolonifer]
IQRSKSMRTICELFDLVDYYEEAVAKQKSRLEEAEKNQNTENAKRDREEEQVTKAEEPVEKKTKTE